MAQNNEDGLKGRDGLSSGNEKPQEGEKKKRMRVGDLRKQSFSSTAESNSRGMSNPYKSGERGEQRHGGSSSYGSGSQSRQRSSYGSSSDDRYNQDRPSYNSDGGRQRTYSGGSYNSSREGGYNNRDNQGYNSRQGGGGYNRDNGNERRPYGNNNNRGGGGGYNNQGGGGYSQGGRPSYNNQGPRKPRPGGGGGFSKAGAATSQGRPGDKKLIKPVKYKENADPTAPLRLNKYLANAGVCSRREADAFITAGVVKVNGEVVDQLGAKVTRADLVTFHDQPVRIESKVYVLLNKPKNCVTTSDDPQNRITVMDLVKGACPERIYPVGRLDRNTTGVLLLTNDGDLASKLTHPKFMKKKIYQVTLDKDVAIEDMQRIADGVELDDGEIHADSIAYQAEDVLNVVGIEIHSGRNRVVRRIFEKLGYQVVKLDRVYFAGLTKKNLPRGRWRYLTEKEVNMLRMGAFE